MTRSHWKNPFIDKYIYKKILNNSSILENIKSRQSTILKPFVGKIFQIYNGFTYIKLKISEEMIGHKFGEFSFTKKRHIYKKKKKK